MKKTFLAGIALAVVISLGFVGCKEDDALEATLSVQTLAGSYKLTELTQETSVTPKASIMGRLETCMLDDIYQLKSDSTANYIDAGVNCSPANNYAFSYKLTSTAVTLIGLHTDAFPGGTVKKWNGTTLVLQAKVKNEFTNNIEVTITSTFVKQP